jgi:transitional endoplasmic reticulum ATPase
LAKKKKTLESRAESYKKAFDRHLDLVEEAEQAGDLVRLRRNLGYAVEAWLSFTEAATSPTIRAAREQNAEKLIDWYESLPEDAADLPAPGANGGGGSSSGGGGRGSNRGRKVKEGKDDAKDFIPVERPTLSFSDIAGLEDVKEDIRLKMIYPFSHPEAAARYKIRRGGGILLWGPPGTGKTMMARAVAGEIEAAFFTVKPSEIMSKWVGDSEQNIEALFKTARSHERSIIFIDEIEALIPARRGESGSPIMKRLVPQILAELEGFGTSDENPLLFIGATNEPWSLDPAVLRPGRFDEKVYVGLPDRPARRKILELNLAGRPLADDVDLDVLADQTISYSGADMKNICERAAADCFLKAVKSRTSEEGAPEEDPPIAMEDLLGAVRETRPSVTAEDLEKFIEYRDTNWGGGAE